MSTRKADAGGSVVSPEKPEARPGAVGAPPAPPVAERAPVVLPDARSTPMGALEDKMVVIYGASGIGKSTLASEWGNVLFFECEPGLDDLEVYRVKIPDWPTFCEYVNAAKLDPGKYDGYCIDTIDMLALFCSAHTNAKLGIIHESDAEWGKGWDVAKSELQRWIGKLAALPGGLLVISHSQEVEIKTRNLQYTKNVPTMKKGARETVISMADLVLFCDFEDVKEGGEKRVIRTKPSRYWDAKERGRVSRLPETIDWPIGHGFDAIKKAWEGK